MPLPNARYWNGYDRRFLEISLTACLFQELTSGSLANALDVVPGTRNRKNPATGKNELIDCDVVVFTWEVSRDRMHRLLHDGAFIWNSDPANIRKLRAELGKQLGRIASNDSFFEEKMSAHDAAIEHVLQAFFNKNANEWDRFNFKIKGIEVKPGESINARIKKQVVKNFWQVMLELMHKLDAECVTECILATPGLELEEPYTPDRIRNLQAFEGHHHQLKRWVSGTQDKPALERVMGAILALQIDQVLRSIQTKQDRGSFYHFPGPAFKEFEIIATDDGKKLPKLFTQKEPKLRVSKVHDYYDRVDPECRYRISWMALSSMSYRVCFDLLSNTRVLDDASDDEPEALAQDAVDEAEVSQFGDDEKAMLDVPAEDAHSALEEEEVKAWPDHVDSVEALFIHRHGWPLMAAQIIQHGRQRGGDEGRALIDGGLRELRVTYEMPLRPLNAINLAWLADEHFKLNDIETPNRVESFLAILRDHLPDMFARCMSDFNFAQAKKQASKTACTAQ